MMTIYIDNILYNVTQNYTIFQFCAKLGINLPCFCYHERLNIAGNCRICLVEANSALVISCATLLLDKMDIFTNNKRVKKARERVLELLLVNHPLDCAICDKGGECDLQDITITYGSPRGRYYETKKKAVTFLNSIGPFVKTVMTRCIHCTRCVRFINDIGGNPNFGLLGRGSNMEIGTYIEDNLIDDELLSNIVDLCPVGALTPMMGAFENRAWEYKFIKSIDITNSIASRVRLAVVGNEIKRITPDLDEFYEEFLTNKARYIYDSFNTQRNQYPKLKLYYKYVTLSWKNTLIIFLRLLYNKRKNIISVLIGNYISLDVMYTVKQFLNSIGSSNINYIEDKNKPFIDFQSMYLLNTSLNLIDEILILVLIGCNPRFEAPLLNSLLRKNYLSNEDFKVYSIGEANFNITYPVINIGASIKTIYKYLKGTILAAKYIIQVNNNDIYYHNIKNIFLSYFYIGAAILQRNDCNSIIKSLYYFHFENNIDFNRVNILNKSLGRLSYLELGGFKPKNNIIKNIKNLRTLNWLLDTEDIDKCYRFKKNVNIYQGPFHISSIYKYINIILPTQLYTETSATYINLEGKYRSTNKAITCSKQIKGDIELIESLLILIKKTTSNNYSIINNINEILKNFNMFDIKYEHYILNKKKYISNYNESKQIYNNTENNMYMYSFIKNKNIKLNNTIINTVIEDFYNFDTFSQKSRIMIETSNKIKWNLYKHGK